MLAESWEEVKVIANRVLSAHILNFKLSVKDITTST
jgi:hypothetical protein